MSDNTDKNDAVAQATHTMVTAFEEAGLKGFAILFDDGVPWKVDVGIDKLTYHQMQQLTAMLRVFARHMDPDKEQDDWQKVYVPRSDLKELLTAYVELQESPDMYPYERTKRVKRIEDLLRSA